MSVTTWLVNMTFDWLKTVDVKHVVVQCVATVMMLAGVVFFGILIGSLGEIVQHASTRARQAQMFRRKFEDVETWMHMRRLPRYTQKKIRYRSTVELTNHTVSRRSGKCCYTTH